MTSRSFLRTPSEAAGPGDEATIQDLVDTLEANRSRCVGMAANMIGVSKRIIVFVDEDLGGRITVMLNPVITASDGAFDAQEGCLSLTGERRTLRCRRIEVNYEDRRFRARHATFTGWTAQIIQHEVDHCNGIIIRFIRCSLQPTPPPPRLVIAITMQLHRNRYDQPFCALVGWVFSSVLGCHALAGWLR